jgi:hypothetical protein
MNIFSQTGWTPAPEVTNHSGSVLNQELFFFATPPKEIGEIFSAYSTLKKGETPTPTDRRIIIAMIAAIVGIVIGGVIDYFAEVRDTFWLLCWPGIGALLGLLVGWRYTSFAHTCTFVGALGVAEFKCNGSIDNITETKTLEFKKAWALTTAIVDHYTNGVYQNTEYTYAWYESDGKHHFTIAGSHYSSTGLPPEQDYYNYAYAAENSWSYYLLGKAADELKTRGYLYFGIGTKDWIKLAPEALEISLGGKTDLCKTEDIGSATLVQGMFTLRRKDATSRFFGLFGTTGEFSFAYRTLTNAKLFLLAFEKLMGLRIN